MIDIEALREVPPPTAAQRARFIEYLLRRGPSAVFQYDRSKAHGALPDESGVARYLHVEQLLRAIYKSLHAEEVAKIESTIDRVCAVRHARS